jgi:FkbM family methyltransferase
MNLNRWMRNRILDTSLEPLARSLYLRFSPAHGVRYERQLHVVMRRVLHPYANCLDIGAYRDGVLRDILRYAPHGRHLAFEPVPAQAAYLRQQFPDMTIHAVALSDTTGTAPFHHVVSRPTYSGLRMVQYPSSNEHIEQIEVPLCRLDELVPAALPIHFIKIDVEGAEYLVLRGGLATITRNRPIIVFEHGLTSPWYYQIPSADVYDLLTQEAGVQVSLMRRWLADEPPLSRDQFVDEVSEARNYYFIAYPAVS